MMNKSLNTLAIVLVTLILGCGSSIKMATDGQSETDGTPDGATDTVVEPGEDTPVDGTSDPGTEPSTDSVPDSTGDPECSDGLDNDGDDLIDMEDFDCESPSDTNEGSDTDECENDNHCDGGWEECDESTHTCYEPPHGSLCDPCEWRGDCGDGIEDEGDPDVDWCLTYGPGSPGVCTKDCRGDRDCPRGFYCEDAPDGMCLALSGCSGLEDLGNGCSGDWECGSYYSPLECHGGICTLECVIEHDCVSGMSCVDGWCAND
ncbi:MAG: hypothetical protein JRG91_07730 [Deltaproteobacteria bacterium]|nr:hypothetical protein [Deltaproteobacteria bacterium]